MQEVNDALLELHNRERLKLTGVQHIDVFEEEKIVLRTEQGLVEIQGMHLNITHLDQETKILQIEGSIDAIAYPQNRHKRKNKNRPQQSIIQRMLS